MRWRGEGGVEATGGADLGLEAERFPLRRAVAGEAPALVRTVAVRRCCDHWCSAMAAARHSSCDEAGRLGAAAPASRAYRLRRASI
jgi:hypothetical protein